MTTDDFKPGDHVLYVPHHAHGDRSHADCEHGIVSSKNDVNVFVRYYFKGGGLRENGQATSPGDLVKT